MYVRKRVLTEVIVSDLQRSFGYPILDAYGIRTKTIYERFLGGDDVQELVADYEIPSEDIQKAIRWHAKLKYPNLRPLGEWESRSQRDAEVAYERLKK